ncbi:MAG: hypothetical protein LBV73_05030 [Paraburkholderia sp.]|nr:hypothetical protein [Paraburkholderia sp.]
MLTVLLDTPDGDDPPPSVRGARGPVLKKIASPVPGRTGQFQPAFRQWRMRTSWPLVRPERASMEWAHGRSRAIIGLIRDVPGGIELLSGNTPSSGISR